MTQVTCDECGTDFETERDPAAPGADTTRCPSCGTRTTAPAPDGGADAGASISVEEGADVHIHIHIHRDAGL